MKVTRDFNSANRYNERRCFSNFASMPAQQNETLNVVGVVELAFRYLQRKQYHLQTKIPEIISKIDRTQLVRIITI
jgi:hypothetical protein